MSSDSRNIFYEGEPETPQEEQPPADYAEILESLAADETFGPVDEALEQYAREVQAINLHPGDSSGDERWSDVFMRNQSEQTYDPDSLMREKAEPWPAAGRGRAAGIDIPHPWQRSLQHHGRRILYKPVHEHKDVSRNVVAVGEVLQQTLSALGVESIHCDKLHDESYNDSIPIPASRSSSTWKNTRPSR